MKESLSLKDQNKLVQFAKSAPQSILIEGKSGLGLFEAARYFADAIGATVSELKPIDRATEKIDMEHGKILVPQIRELYTSTRSKTTRSQVVIIHRADRMTLASQGALLKLLEEPHEKLHFVLLTERVTSLLPTVLSRLSRVRLHPISQEQSEKLLDQLQVTDKTKRQQILFIAGGLPLHISRLASDDKYFKAQVEITAAAKQLLLASSYEKLVTIGQYKENRQQAIELIDKALLIGRRSIKAQPTEQLAKQIAALIEARENLEANSNVRLALMNGVLQ